MPSKPGWPQPNVSARYLSGLRKTIEQPIQMDCALSKWRLERIGGIAGIVEILDDADHIERRQNAFALCFRDIR